MENKIVTLRFNFRIYPTKAQKEYFHRCFGCNDWLWNEALNFKSTEYKLNKNNVTSFDIANLLTKIKRIDEYSWLKEVDSTSLQQSLLDLNNAFNNFFSKKAKYPRYKSKKRSRRSYRTMNVNNSIRIIDDEHIKLPKVGTVKIKLHRHDFLNIHSATIIKLPSDKYNLSLCVDYLPTSKPYTNKATGIDLGLTHFLTLSSGPKKDNPHYLIQSQKKLKKAQRKLSKCDKGSKRYYKQKRRVALIHERIKNQRNSFLHELSSQIINENQVIGIEDLKVKNMLKNKHLSKAISDVGWSKFVSYLEYKANMYNRELIKIGTYYPSSQICSVCGFKEPSLKALTIRKWQCPACQSIHDRDINAAINILKEALRIRQELPKSTLVESFPLLELQIDKQEGSLNREAQKL